MVAGSHLRLAGVDVTERHICVLHRGRDELYAQIGPLIADGFEAGDHELHLVEEVESHLGQLRDIGIAVDERVASGQLTVETWVPTVIADGQFSRSAMTRRIRHYFDSVAARGGGRTRWIATMGWAASGVPGLEDFVPFEDHLNDVLRGRRDVIVCAYDVDQHDAALIADTVAVHPVTLIRGKLQPPSKAAPVSPRERILTAADDHFHAFGIRSTGVDTLIDAAGVAKATFYRTFSSKDELVVAWLRDRRPRWFYPMRDTLEESGLLPADRVPELFRLVADWLAQDGFRGCAFQNTAVEIVDSTHPVRALIRDYLDEIDEYLRRQVEAAGFAAPEELASQLGVLLAGALAAGAARHSRAPVVAALETAETLLRVAPRA